ncbi:unnamed protein product [Rotaria sp. Silwood2]|nr:unnamed protein product [Rotaria sp. Silwood2]CAF2896529.1 unnamed protein product [Rotaria sp. Silwood2]CAF3078788.1 unnamed protein product [Rotaria sp. Silwood2]CAF4453681.1 unnamed protein product [Rotaria sp. Silwood2]CAF4456644.1 unnamed protein product [Rotaria sp. Silwood2]
MDSSDDLDERRQRKLAQMSRRDEERKLDLQTKQDERKLATSTNIGRKYFDQEYPLMKSQTEDLFSQLSVNHDEKFMQELADRLQQMEKFITEHVDILRSRDIANAQSDVMKLRAQLHALQYQNLSSSHRMDFTKSNEENSKQEHEESNLITPSTNIIVSSNTINISNKNNELIRFDSSALNGKDVAIENLKQCELFLKGVPSSLQIKNLHACILIVGPCSRSILIDQCEQCEFALACQQLRIHTSNECDFYVHITAQPIIEDCHNLRFAPYNVEYNLKDEHIKQSGLMWTKDYWNDVRDFNHMIVGMPSPNWQIIEEEERKEWSLD